MKKLSISLVMCVLLLVILLILGVMFPDEPVKFITSSICSILWFITGFIQGKDVK